MEVRLTNLLDQECNISDLAEGVPEEGMRHREDNPVLGHLVEWHIADSCAEEGVTWTILGGLHNPFEP